MSPANALKILYVEDDAAMMRLVKTRLSAAGHVVTIACTYGEAISLFDSCAFDIVLTDYDLPDGTGLDLLRSLKDRNARCATVMATSVTGETIAVEGMKLGLSDYLIKDDHGMFMRSLPHVIEMAWQKYCREREKHDLETELKQSELRFRTLVSNIPGIIYSATLDESRRLFYVSNEYETMTGNPHFNASLSPVFLLDMIHEKDKKRVGAALAKAIAERVPFELEYRIRRKDGQWLWVFDKGQPVFDSENGAGWIDGVIFDIMARKQSEKQRELSQFSVENADDAVFWMNSAGMVVYANKSACRLTGYPIPELIGMHVSAFNQMYLTWNWRFRWDEIRIRGRTRYDAAFITKNGEKLNVVVAANFLNADDEQLVCSFVRDVTEQKRTLDQLNMREYELSIHKKIAEIFLTNNDENVYNDVLTVLLPALESPFGLFGYIDETGALILPSYSAKVMEACKMDQKSLRFPESAWGKSLWGQALKEKRTILSNMPGKVPAGHLPIERTLIVPILFSDEPIGLIMVANKNADYTAMDQSFLDNIAQYIASALHARLDRNFQDRQRRLAEQELRNRTAQLTQHVQEIGCMQAISELLQTSTQSESDVMRKLVNIICSGVRHPDIAASRILFDGCVYAQDQFQETPWKLAAPIYINNELHGAWELCYLLNRGFNEDGPFLPEEKRMLEDMSQRLGLYVERNLADAQVKSLKQQIEFILGTSKTGLDIIDENGFVTYVDPARVKIYGPYEGKKCHEYFGCNLSMCPHCVVTKGIGNMDIHFYESVIELENKRPVQITRIPFTDPEGKQLCARVIVDMSERKKIESELNQAQRLEAVGQLAAGIAHEINTPTQFVSDNTRFLQDAFQDLNNVFEMLQFLVDAAEGEPIKPELLAQLQKAAEESDFGYLREEIPRAIQQSLDGLQRVAGIVRAMKEFSHPGSDLKQSIDVVHAIQNAVTISRNEWKYVADMQTDFDPNMSTIYCIPGDFNQVMLNLIVNAAHAIGEKIGANSDKKGIIRVQTRCDGDWAEITVSDNGTGIPESIRSRIYDPFFTTKEVGKGSGQGLSIAHTIVVKKHGGTIHFNTQPGEGTTFHICFPLNPPQAEPKSTIVNVKTNAERAAK